MTTPVLTIRSMLAALDDSPRAPLVLSTASMMARRLGARLFLIRVLIIPPEIPPAARTRSDGVDRLLEAEAGATLRGFMDSEPGVRFGPPVVVEGDPWRRILEVSQQLDVELIVIGSHRYHGLDRVLGTVAAKVVNHADRNVLVVHERR